MAFRFFALLFLATSVFADTVRISDAPVNVRQSYKTNFAPNPVAFRETSGWTATSVTLARDTDAADKFDGIASFALTSATHTASIRTNDIALPKPYADGGNCQAWVWFKGDGTKWDLKLKDSGGSNTLNSVTMTNETGWKRATFFYPCTNNARIYVESNASSPANINVGGFYWGPAVDLGDVSQASRLGTLQYPATLNCGWSLTSGTYANFSADADCATPTVTGSASAPGTKIPGVTFSSLSAGKYLVVARGNFIQVVTAGNQIAKFRISDGTTPGKGEVFLQGTAGSGAISSASVIFSEFEYSTSQSNVTFQVQGAQSGGTGTVQVVANTSYDQNFDISVYRYPTSSEIAVRPDQSDFGWIPFTTTVSNLGAGSVSPSEMFYKRSGDSIIVRYRGTKVTNGSGASSVTFSLPVTLDFTKMQNTTSTQVGSASKNSTNLFLFADNSSATTLRLNMTGADWLDTEVLRFTSDPIPVVGWTNNQAAPLLVGSVTSNSAGLERTERAVINCSGSSSISSQSGTWLSSVGNISSGACAVTFSGSPFTSNAYSCFFTPQGSIATQFDVVKISSKTTSGFTMTVINQNGATTAASGGATFDIHCQGPR